MARVTIVIEDSERDGKPIVHVNAEVDDGSPEGTDGTPAENLAADLLDILFTQFDASGGDPNTDQELN